MFDCWRNMIFNFCTLVSFWWWWWWVGGWYVRIIVTRRQKGGHTDGHTDSVTKGGEFESSSMQLKSIKFGLKHRPLLDILWSPQRMKVNINITRGGGVVDGLIPINEFSSFQHISAGSENQDAGKQNVRHSNCKIPLFWDALHMVYVEYYEYFFKE